MMKNGVRKWFAISTMVAASALGLTGLSRPETVSTARAAAVPITFSELGRLIPTTQGGVIRRESGPPLPGGKAPLTGPPSLFNPLAAPNFGANIRANTDTQSPNLAQQEPSISINPTNSLNIVAAAKDERSGSNTKQIWI